MKALGVSGTALWAASLISCTSAFYTSFSSFSSSFSSGSVVLRSYFVPSVSASTVQKITGDPYLRRYCGHDDGQLRWWRGQPWRLATQTRRHGSTSSSTSMLFDFIKKRAQEGVEQTQNLVTAVQTGRLDEALKETSEYVKER